VTVVNVGMSGVEANDNEVLLGNAEPKGEGGHDVVLFEESPASRNESI
jgi:hypothetical protein